MATIIRQRKRPVASRADAGPGGPWHSSLPRRISARYRALGDPDCWTRWRQHLAGRRLPNVARLIPSRRHPLLWCLPPELEGSPAVSLVTSLAHSAAARKKNGFRVERDAQRWLDEALARAPDLDLLLECLAWSGALADRASQLDEEPWWRMLNLLVGVAAESAQQRVPAGAAPLGQLLRGELALTLAYEFPELEVCRGLVTSARRAISRTLTEVLDGVGLIHASYLHDLRPILACWTRCCALASRLEPAWCDESVARQYPLFVQHALRWSRASGAQPFIPEAGGVLDRDLVKHAVRLARDPTARRVARLATGASNAGGAHHKPTPTLEGQWAAMAMLRSDWRPSSPRLAITYPATKVQLELSVGKDCLLSGDWEVEVHHNGQQLTPGRSWEQVCWESDDEVDYLELELPLDSGVTVQRHVLLARSDRFLFLADAVLGSEAARIEYRGLLPLAGRAAFVAEEHTREGTLEAGDQRRARVVPLALPEWRASPARGSLQAAGVTLELRQTVDGRRLLAPLFVDLDSRRSAREVTWRQLTVAEDRRIVPSDVAVGYRVQAGKSQWLVYRSLGAPAIRSVLGTNLMHELMLAEFQRDGSARRLLEIEGT